MVGGFQFAVWSALRVGFVMESAVGERAAQPLVEEQEEQRDVNAIGGETVGVAASIALQQAVPFELAQIVAKLVESVLFRGELERSEDGFMNLFGRRAADGIAAMQQDFQKANGPRVLDFDAWNADCADGHGQGNSPEQRKVHMDVQRLCLEAGEAVGDELELLAHLVEMVQPFLQAEVAQVVGDQFVAKIARVLFVLLEKCVFPVGATGSSGCALSWRTSAPAGTSGSRVACG